MATERYQMDHENGWVSEQFVNHAARTVHLKYFYKGRIPASFVTLKTRKALHYAGYVLIDKDLRDARMWLEDVQQHKGELESCFASPNSTPPKYIFVKGLIKAAVVNYQKCFYRARGRLVKLDKSQLPEKLHSKHDEIENMRNEYAAHGGTSDYEKCEVIVAFPPRAKSRKGDSTFMIDHVLQQAALMDCDDLLELIDAARSIAKAKMTQLRGNIAKEICSTDPDKLYAVLRRSSDVYIDDKALALLKPDD